MAYEPPGYLRIDLPRPRLSRDRGSVGGSTRDGVYLTNEIQIYDENDKLQGTIAGITTPNENILYDAQVTGGHRFTVNDVLKLDIGPTEILAADDFRPNVDDSLFLGSVSLNWASIFTTGIQLNDSAANPTTDGEFTLNDPDVKVFSGSGVRNLTNITNNREVALEFIIDGDGEVISTGEKGFIEIPYGFTITGWTILSDVSGSIVIDVWADTYANFPPVVGDSIAASAKPTLSSAQKNQDLTLTGWTTAIAAGDVIAFNVDSVTTITRVVVSLRGTKI